MDSRGNNCEAGNISFVNMWAGCLSCINTTAHAILRSKADQNLWQRLSEGKTRKICFECRQTAKTENNCWFQMLGVRKRLFIVLYIPSFFLSDSSSVWLQQCEQNKRVWSRLQPDCSTWNNCRQPKFDWIGQKHKQPSGSNQLFSSTPWWQTQATRVSYVHVNRHLEYCAGGYEQTIRPGVRIGGFHCKLNSWKQADTRVLQRTRFNNGANCSVERKQLFSPLIDSLFHLMCVNFTCMDVISS